MIIIIRNPKQGKAEEESYLKPEKVKGEESCLKLRYSKKLIIINNK